MATRLQNLVLEEVSLVDRPANPGARVALFKRDTPGGDSVTEQELKKKNEELSTSVDSLTKANIEFKTRAEKAEAELATVKSDLAKAQEAVAKADPETAKKALLASMPPAAREAFEKQAQEQIDLRKRLDEVEKRHAAVEFEKVAKANFGNLDTSSVASVLQTAKASFTEELYKKLTDLLGSANTAVGSLFKSTGRGTDNSGTAYDAISKKAEEIQKRDNCDFNDAIEKVAREHPDLMRNYEADRTN